MYLNVLLYKSNHIILLQLSAIIDVDYTHLFISIDAFGRLFL